MLPQKEKRKKPAFKKIVDLKWNISLHKTGL